MAIAINEADVERVIKEKVASGEYDCEADVLRAAIRSLQAEDEEVAAIEKGLTDVRAGRTEPFDQADAEFRRKHNIPQDA